MKERSVNRMKTCTEPVLTPEAVRAWEHAAFAGGVSSLLLMEDAARRLMETLRPLLAPGDRTLIVCGPGNNGGDGAALGRLLLAEGRATLLAAAAAPATDDARTMRAYYEALGGQAIDGGDAVGAIAAFRPDCVVDALFGTGFHGAPEGLYADLIGAVNRSGARVVLAVDIPSGLNGRDGSFAVAPDGSPLMVRATHTVTLGAWKPGLLLTQAPVGRLTRARIALPDMAPETDLRLLTGDALRWIPPRARDAHKGTAGRVLMYMGTEGMAGAAAMAALAALRAGAGLVTVACPREILPTVQALVPNAMCVPADTLTERIPPHDALAAGCGLGQGEAARATLAALLARETGPAVLDADALNLLAAAPFPLPPETVLTPHPGEAARLAGLSVRQVTGAPLDAARSLADRYHAAVLLKGTVSLATDGQRTLVQRRGAPSLAKGGSGDALTGILAAFCADRTVCADQRGRDRLVSCAALASLCLGLAGERAQADLGDRSALTGDVIDRLPEVLSGRSSAGPDGAR